MGYVKSALLAGVVAVLSSGVWAQQDPRIGITVTPIPTSITLSRPGSGRANLPLTTYAAYQVSITNGATNTLNRVFFNATAANFGGADVVAYDSFVANTGDTCTVGATSNSVTCSLASLQPGLSTTFFVVFIGPQTGQRIDLTWTAGGFEGNGGGNGCCSQTDAVSTALVDPTTDTTYLTQAKTFVKANGGGTLFTGDQAIPTGSTDGWTTLVTIPGFNAQIFTTAAINEVSNADDPSLACPGYSTNSTCFRTKLSIPGTFPGTFDNNLQIVLRLDKSFFNLGRTSVAAVPLFYTGDGTAPSGTTYPHQLRLCSDDLVSYGQAPRSGRPCFSEPPKILPNNSPIRDLRGDLEFNIRALDNGRYEQ